MTGAGSSTVAFAKESTFNGSLVDNDSDGTPEYYLPGRNITFDEISLGRALERMDLPNQAEAADSVAGLFDGALSASWTMSLDTHQHVRDIVFNDAGAGFTPGRATTSRWFLGVDHLSGTVERELKAVIPLEYSIQYNADTNTVQESGTFGYAEEASATSITPGSIVGPTDGSDVPFHGTTLTVDGITVAKLQSATLSFSNISRYQSGPNPTPLDATLAQPRTTLDATTIFEGSDYLELAYGSSGAGGLQDTMNNVAGELAFDVNGTTVAMYTLPKLKPDSYDWSDLVNGENDLTEPVTYHVNGGVSVA